MDQQVPRSTDHAGRRQEAKFTSGLSAGCLPHNMPHADWSRHPSFPSWPVTGRWKSRSNCTGDQATARKEDEFPQQFQLLSSTVPVTQHSLKSPSSVVLGDAMPWNVAAVGHQTLAIHGRRIRT